MRASESSSRTKTSSFFTPGIFPAPCTSIGAPIDVHGAGNMPGVVKEDVFVRLDDSDALILEMLLEPIGFHQSFRMRVLRRMRSHKTTNFNPLSNQSKRI